MRNVSSLGILFKGGVLGVEQSDAKAVRWYRKAIARGDSCAQNYIGLMCQEGRGVAQSDVKAVQCFRKAANQGDVPAQCTMGLIIANGVGVPRSDIEAVQWYSKAAA